MLASPAQPTCIRTDRVPAEQRVAYWEDELRNHMVGFRCSSHANEGLLAQQTCLDLGLLRIGTTRANAHVIERTPELIRLDPRDSAFINVVCQDDTFVYQRGHCMNVHRGDVMLYDARHPYLMGCGGSMHLLHIDLPIDYFQARFRHTDLNKPVLASGAAGAGKLYSAALRRLHEAVMRQGGGHDSSGEYGAGAVRDQIGDLLASMLGCADSDTRHSALGASHVLAARAYIEAHLQEETLTAEEVAEAVGVSVRHLSRLFAAQQTSMAELILRQRLERAHEQLCDGRYADQSVATTAYRWGFASHAHFSRAFKEQFGQTPTEARRARGH